MRLIDADALEKRFEYLETFENDLVHKVTEEEKGMRTAYHLAKYETHVAPTISPENPQPQWIPVTERLPECGEHYESNDVLVSVDYRPDDPEETKDTFVSIDHVCFNCFGQGVFSIERDNPYDTEPSPYFVTHWLPLPEPYTAKVEDDDNARRVKPLEFDRFKNDTLKDAQTTTPAHWEKADIPLPYQMRTVPTPNGTFAHREMYVCSACDGYNDKNTQYCPHCGARMDKEVNDDD